MPLYLVHADPDEPLVLDTVKLQVKLPTGVSDYPENPLIEDILIPAVRQRCERATGRGCREATYDWKRNGFPACGWLEFPYPPLQSVQFVKYLDTAGVLQTLTKDVDYVVSAPGGEKPARGRIARAANTVWPATLDQIEAVTIRFVCGYPVDEVPAILKAAMLPHAATLYADRENLIKGTVVAEVPGGRRGIYWQWKSHPTQL